MLEPSRRALALGFVSLLVGCSPSAVEGLSPRDPDVRPAHPDAPRDVVASDYAARVDLLALGYADGRFEVRSPAPRHVLAEGKHHFQLLNLALSPDGRFLASADAAGNVAISAVESGDYGVLPKLPHADGIIEAAGLAWDARSKRLAIALGPDVRIVEPETGNSHERSLRDDASAVTFTPKGDQLIVAGRQLTYLDATSLEPLRVSNAPRPSDSSALGNVLDLRFSPDGRWLGVLHTGGVVLSDQRGDRAEVIALVETSPVGLRFAHDGRVAIFGRHALYVGPPSAADVPVGLRKTSGELWDVEFRQDGSLMFLGDTADAELASVLE